MAPSSKSHYTGTTEGSSGIKLIIVLMPIIAIIGLIWLLLLKLEYLPDNLTLDQNFQAWLNIWSVIFLIIIVSLLLSIPHGRSTSAPKSATSTKSKSIKADPKKKTSSPSTETLQKEDQSGDFVPLSKSSQATDNSKMSLKTSATPMVDTDSQIDETLKAEEEMKAAEIVAKPASKDKMKPVVIEYPMEVEGGLYGDTFIELNPESMLKLRTLVVKDIYLM